MNGTVKAALVVGMCAIGAAAGTPFHRVETATPAITMVYPSTNNQLVTTMRNSELHPILGSVYSPNGINRCTVFVKRVRRQLLLERLRLGVEFGGARGHRYAQEPVSPLL